MLMLPALMPASTAAEISPFSFAPPPPSSNLFLSCSSKLPKCTRAFFSGGSSEDIAFADRCKLSHSQSSQWSGILIRRSAGRRARRAGTVCVIVMSSRLRHLLVGTKWSVEPKINRNSANLWGHSIKLKGKREKEIMPTEGEGEGRDFGRFCIFISRSCGVFSSISKRTLYWHYCDHNKQIVLWSQTYKADKLRYMFDMRKGSVFIIDQIIDNSIVLEVSRSCIDVGRDNPPN